MKKIEGTPKTVRELFTGIKYTIHYYQREYQWQTKQIEELIDDLTEEFLEYYSEDHERTKVLQYGHYFMGSIVLTSDDNAIIDGQQRLTSITLILLYLYHRIQDTEEKSDVRYLIHSLQAGKRTFTINTPELPERNDVMTALVHDHEYDISQSGETVKNIINRYTEIKNKLDDLFNDELTNREAVLMFKDWLIDNVEFIRIIAQTEQDAHKIFVSMNDRGLSLTPAEMLKGYLLSKIENDDIRQRANDLWKARIQELKTLGKEEESDFIKNWIRAQYAESIRERKKNAIPCDFEMIGTAFHKWVREHNDVINLKQSKDYENFILKEFDKFSSIYLALKRYSQVLTPGFEHVFYNANRNFTLQYQLILAGIHPDDSQVISDKKIKLISSFLDLYFTRRIINYKTVDYSAILYNIFILSKSIRRKPLEEMKALLQNEIQQMEFQFDKLGEFRLNGWTVRYMLHILARITDFVEQGSGIPSHFSQYVNRESKNPYDIEHIICDQYDRYGEEFSEDFKDEEDFQKHRNLIGALLILPMDINRSLSDASYQYKLNKYNGQNILAQSLSKNCYKNNPQFLTFCAKNSFDFKAYEVFNKTVLLERQGLIENLIRSIWDVSILDSL